MCIYFVAKYRKKEDPVPAWLALSDCVRLIYTHVWKNLQAMQELINSTALENEAIY